MAQWITRDFSKIPTLDKILENRWFKSFIQQKLYLQKIQELELHLIMFKMEFVLTKIFPIYYISPDGDIFLDQGYYIFKRLFPTSFSLSRKNLDFK